MVKSRKGHPAIIPGIEMKLVLGYRHVYLEGMAASSIFLHITIIDLTGKVRDNDVIIIIII